MIAEHMSGAATQASSTSVLEKWERAEAAAAAALDASGDTGPPATLNDAIVAGALNNVNHNVNHSVNHNVNHSVNHNVNHEILKSSQNVQRSAVRTRTTR